MVKYNIPKRVYSSERDDKTNKVKRKTMISIRLPEPLLEELKLVAEERGWPMTDLVITVLDQYLQWNQKQKD